MLYSSIFEQTFTMPIHNDNDKATFWFLMEQSEEQKDTFTVMFYVTYLSCSAISSSIFSIYELLDFHEHYKLLRDKNCTDFYSALTSLSHNDSATAKIGNTYIDFESVFCYEYIPKFIQKIINSRGI